jgi:hypothetical protein
MKRSAVTADILTAIQACFGARCQDYIFSRSRGIPPADCNSIAASWVDRTVAHFADCDTPAPCEDWQATHGLRIVITNICAGPDAQETFDWRSEDAAAACFEDDVDLLETCIQCGDWTQLYNDHFLTALRYDGTTFDVESEGGGFSAYIEITLVAGECCP